MYFELIATITSLILIWLFLDQVQAKNLPPGPFRLPIFGNLFHVVLAHPKYVFEAFEKLSTKYGKIMRLRLGLRDIIVLTSFEDMKDLLARDEFSGRQCIDNYKDRCLGDEHGIVFTSGEHWNTIRKFTVRNLRDFGFGKKASMESMLQLEAEDVTKNLLKELDNTKNGKVNFHRNYFSPNILNIIFSMLAGVRFEHGDPKLDELVKINNKAITSGNFGAGILGAFPFLRFIFPEWTGFKAQVELTSGLKRYFTELMVKHRSREGYQDDPECFADVFLAQIEKSCGTNPNYFTETEFLVVYSDLFSVAAETTNGSISYAVLYLLLNSEIQDKMRKEIDEQIGTRIPNLADKAEMPYTTAVLWEVLRIGNIVPVIPPRKTMVDVHYKGFYIPKNSSIVGNLYSILFDEAYWGDPTKFRPDRYLKTDTNGKLTFVPDERLSYAFGIGKRSCLGDQLALSALFLITTSLVQNFTFEALKGQPLPKTDPEVGFTMSPSPFECIVKSRQK